MLPMDPGPKGKFSSTREGETIAALAESRGVLANLKAFLAPFTPRFITDSTTGLKFEVLARPAGAGVVGGAETNHPFRVSFRNTGTEGSPVWEYKVYLGSSLFKSLRPNDKQTLVGLDDWFALSGSGKIWLGITFTTAGVVDTSGIDSGGISDAGFDLTKSAWSGDNGYCEDDGETVPTHQTSRKLIAYVNNGVVNQVMFHNQVLRNVCIDGRPARYPFDHEGGYPL